MVTKDFRKEFGRKVQVLMLKKGWNQSELARRADMGRDNVSGYIRGKNIPNSKHLKKLAEALDVQPDDLYPGLIASLVDETPKFEFKSLNNAPGKVMLRISQVVSEDVAIQVIAILRKEAAK